MALTDFKAREILLMVIGWAIALLLIVTCSRLYVREYRVGILCLLIAAGLAFVFFRKRKVILAIISLSWLLVNAGFTVPFHPSVMGYALTVGSAVGLYCIARLLSNRYPHLSRKNLHVVFEGEAAMDAENARMEVKAREFAKTRPYGPWLFR